MEIGLNPAFLFAHYGEEVYLDQILEGVMLAHNIGFKSLGLEIYCDEQYEIYNKENIKKIKNCFTKYSMKSKYFVACAPRIKLASLNEEVQREGLKDFKKIVEIVAEMGLVDMISLVTSSPPEMVVSYMDTYPGAPPAFTVLPNDYIWDHVWDVYVDTVEKCLRMYESESLKLSIEPTPMSIVPNSDCYLRLWSEIRSKNLGILIDTSHLFYQRESLPIAIEKVKNHLLGFCICDNNGVEDHHWPPGKGTIGWNEVLKTLKKINYSGSIDLEINVTKNPDEIYTQSRDYLINLLHGE